MPNEFMTARPGRPVVGQGSGVELMRTGIRSQATSGWGVSKCRLGGTVRWRRASAIFMMLASPEPPSACPTLVFTEPSSAGAWGDRPSSARPKPRSSIGSPTRVPVPWASM
jgi:hypothetical protein